MGLFSVVSLPLKSASTSFDVKFQLPMSDLSSLGDSMNPYSPQD